MLMATRRTKGESSIPISNMGHLRADHGKLGAMLATTGSDAALAALRATLGDDGVRAPLADDAAELHDYRQCFRGRALALLLPRDTSQVAALLRLCHEQRIGVVPQGGNTGYSGGATPDSSGRQVIVSLRRLNRIRAVDPVNFTLTAEAGCTLQAVQEAAAAAQRFFPLSLGSQQSCQLGGNLATNAGGLNVLRFGMMRDLTLGIEAVLPDGSVLHGLNALRKDNTGYDLKSLLIGSEGTLAIITAATLKLWPAQCSSATAVLAVADPDAATRLLAVLRAHVGERLTSFELMPRAAVELVRAQLPELRLPFTPTPPCLVLCEISSGAVEALDELLQSALLTSAAQAEIADAVLARSEAERMALWQLRESIPEAQRRNGPSLKHDIAVPLDAIPAFMRRVADWASQAVPEGILICYGHAGDGNLHCNLSARAGTDPAAFRAREDEVRAVIHGLVGEFHGSISAEHGIGQSKVMDLQKYASPVKLALLARLKAAIDPRGIMNPGKLLPAAPP
jgi:FAD/FMN-containing dehydrogenase